MLRYWESQFKFFIQPRTAPGTRLPAAGDELIMLVKQLLYTESTRSTALGKNRRLPKSGDFEPWHARHWIRGVESMESDLRSICRYWMVNPGKGSES